MVRQIVFLIISCLLLSLDLSSQCAMCKAVVEATTNFTNAGKVLEASKGLKPAMKGLDMSEIPEEDRLQERGW